MMFRLYRHDTYIRDGARLGQLSAKVVVIDVSTLDALSTKCRDASLLNETIKMQHDMHHSMRPPAAQFVVEASKAPPSSRLKLNPGRDSELTETGFCVRRCDTVAIQFSLEFSCSAIRINHNVSVVECIDIP
uniref:Uncharacterized protein n=1 Tax=Panagrellus redivivus TaxID=6233 RepID=A0A7E5A0U1_PANRE